MRCQLYYLNMASCIFSAWSWYLVGSHGCLKGLANTREVIALNHVVRHMSITLGGMSWTHGHCWLPT